MATHIDYYFDFSSPYSHIASQRIEALVERHQASLDWHPILLGAIFKTTGQAPLTNYPLKGDYAKLDMARAAREYGINFRLPSKFPIAAVAPARALLWIKQQPDEHVSSKMGAFARATFDAYYIEDRDISDAEVLVTIAQSLNIDADAMLAGTQNPTIKEALRDSVDAAMQRGVFGSPTFIVDGEMFWGSDRLEQIERWIERGGW